MNTKSISTLVFWWCLMVCVWEINAFSRSKSSCPRPDEIAPCQCRVRGPTIQVRYEVHINHLIKISYDLNF